MKNKKHLCAVIPYVAHPDNGVRIAKLILYALGNKKENCNFLLCFARFFVTLQPVWRKIRLHTYVKTVVRSLQNGLANAPLAINGTLFVRFASRQIALSRASDMLRSQPLRPCC